MAYLLGWLLGAVVGMSLLGAGVGWVIRRLFPRIDFGLSIACAMLITAFGAGLTNSSEDRPYWLTVSVYLAAGIMAFFIILAFHRREPPRSSPYEEVEPSFGQVDLPPTAQLRGTPASPTSRAPNWRRGFFRIWVVLALLWGALVMAVASGQIFSPYVPNQAVVVSRATNQARLLDQYGDLYRQFYDAEMRGEMKRVVLGSGDELFVSASASDQELAVQTAEAQRAINEYRRSESDSRRYGALLTLTGAIAIPAAVVLVLGWLIGWAISGFRRV